MDYAKIWTGHGMGENIFRCRIAHRTKPMEVERRINELELQKAKSGYIDCINCAYFRDKKEGNSKGK